MKHVFTDSRKTRIIIGLIALIIVAAIYWPGLSGGFLFDDYPNIVDNDGVQPADAHVSSLIRSALSSPSSELKRPIASLSFAANFLAAGLDPFWMKLTNLVIHLANAALAYLLARRLIEDAGSPSQASRAPLIALGVAFGWAVLPINLTSVLYIVQRMESLANLAVFAGMMAYAAIRRRMIAGHVRFGFTRAIAWTLFYAVIGLLSKETAALLPLYAFILELTIYRGRVWAPEGELHARRIWVTYVALLGVPLVAALSWLLPPLLIPGAWASRNFTMSTRLLSEARIVVDYIGWTLLPLPNWLSFYHDDFVVSTGFLSPVSTLISMVVIAALIALAWVCRNRARLVTAGILLYFGCHLLTGTLLPLELVYEHRNYFASFGVLLALVPLLLAAPQHGSEGGKLQPRALLLGVLMLLWCAQTAATSWAWAEPLRLAEDLANRAPQSPRAQYELGRTYIIFSQYKADSPLILPAEHALERSAKLPDSSILPEQALIFMRARMNRPIEPRWWDSIVEKLNRRRPGVQDESSLGALTQCAKGDNCKLPVDRMVQAYTAALQYDHPRSRLLAMYSDYAWSIMGDKPLALRTIHDAVEAEPKELAYRLTYARMLRSSGHHDEAMVQLNELRRRDIGGAMADDIGALARSLSNAPAPASSAAR
ncbi:hypothetical protein FHW69_000015 [Luteibacter sp. Sphag1AF]|uniref:tetratricopeptide repeat protein n=1 Tax=Luteibacter sp. Sphag1AF TaxID=2587031 RepID=UPI001609D2E1|nr:hypothetical protein [Luteibacter sp. Sphag1AF]MBB3225425.1 hypothetical protein [Luteibacter sp. Sphag1AF]